MATEAPPAPPANQTAAGANAGNRPPVREEKNPQAPKYTRDQSAKAEEKVANDNNNNAKKRKTLIDNTVENLLKGMEGYDLADRSVLLDEISQRIFAVKPVAANAHLRPSMSAVRKEEDLSMPRLTTPHAPGETPIRNIMQQGDQNESPELAAKGGK